MNGHTVEVLPDTGAATSCVCVRDALRLGLRPSGRPVRLKGLGDVMVGEETLPVEVRLKSGRTAVATFVVVRGDIPIVVGRNHLYGMGLMQAFEEDAGEAMWVAGPDMTKAQAVPNLVSGVDDSLTDGELIVEARQKLKAQCEHLCEEDFERLWTVLVRHKKCWLRPKSGQVKFEACFKVSGRPVKAKLRSQSEELREELDVQVQAQLEKGVIRPSKSPWAAAPHLVRKKTGEWRVVIDYRDLNKAMVSDAYPIPRAWDNLQRAAGFQYYVALDMNWGF